MIEQIDEIQLTERQQKAIPVILNSKTFSEGCEKAGIDRTTFYRWLEQEDFRTEFEKQRNTLANEAYNMLLQKLNKAIGTLTELLDTSDDRLKRLVSKDIIEFAFRFKENEELEQRIAEIERVLTKRK